MNASDRSARLHPAVTVLTRSLATTTIVAALAFAAGAPPAGAQTVTPSPIEIRSCATVYEPTPEAVYAMGVLVPAGIEISYVNRAALAIDEISFRLGTDDQPIDVVDHGNFTPGALITHVFWTGSAPVSACRAAAVRFAGSSAFTLTDAVLTAQR